jgi:outer membrane protein assembly factor BamB
MKRFDIGSVVFAAFVSMCFLKLQADDWTRFRGPNGSGLATGELSASSWTDTENMRWKTELPGFGSSSPIIVGDQVIVTCYSGYGLDAEAPGDMNDLKRHVLSFDRTTGKKLWQVDLANTEEEDEYKGFIAEHGYSSSTPTSDGQHLFCFFGKAGVYAFDLEGNQLWNTQVGNFSDPAKWGDGSSPILHDDLVIINAGIVGHALLALNKADGSVAWKVEDPNFTNTWSTPVLVTVDERTELVMSVPKQVFALNPKTGEKLWWADSPIENTVCPSLAEADGVVYAMGGRGGRGIAVRCGGNGDVSESHLVWDSRVDAGICTPIAVNGRIYWSSRSLVSCVNCEDGEEVFKERLKAEEPPPAEGQRRRPTGDYASPVAVGGNVIIVARNGATTIIKASEKFEVVAHNSFDGDTSLFNATPAFSHGDLFVRSNKMLYCIGN